MPEEPPRTISERDAQYLERVERLARRVVAEAGKEGWLRYAEDDQYERPLQHAIHHLSQNLRSYHYEGDGCLDPELMADRPEF